MLFIQGEKREVTIRITSTKDFPFLIRNAKFSLTKRGDNTVFQSGNCTVIDSDITALITTEELGNFVLTYTYEISNELLKATVPIEVKEYANPKY